MTDDNPGTVLCQSGRDDRVRVDEAWVVWPRNQPRPKDPFAKEGGALIMCEADSRWLAVRRERHWSSDPEPPEPEYDRAHFYDWDIDPTKLPSFIPRDKPGGDSPPGSPQFAKAILPRYGHRKWFGDR